VRAGGWSSLVIGTHPVESDQLVWLEVFADETPLGLLPAYWLENKGVNSLWHVPIPPQPVGTRLRYRPLARQSSGEPVHGVFQEALVRPNLPDPSEISALDDITPEGYVGNRMMTVKIDARGSTQDIFFPSVGLVADVRPAEGDLLQSRCHFRMIAGGLAIDRRLDWFCEHRPWETSQRYIEGTNHLETELTYRNGPVRVAITDFAVFTSDLPRTAGGTESPGQYIRRFRITNSGEKALRTLFGVYVRSEINGGIGETGLSWHDGERALVAFNRGHFHANRKLARDATLEFAIALDHRGDVFCEPTGTHEAMILRWLELPPGETTRVDLLVSGAFTGWSGDAGTFDHWLRPALAWFRAADLDQIEADSARRWQEIARGTPRIDLPFQQYAQTFRRSALVASLHADAKWGAIVSGYDRGLDAYCWPRDAVHISGALDRAGLSQIGLKVYDWLSRVRAKERPFTYWFHKYTVDGFPEWESPAVDQTAIIPWGLERLYRRTGNTELIAAHWTVIEQAVAVCCGATGHPGLRRLDDLELISSLSAWDTRYGAFHFPNVCVVAGLRAAARLARKINRDDLALAWEKMADRIWNEGILANPDRHPRGAGMVDAETGRFLEARRVSRLAGLWTDQPEALLDRTSGLEIGLIASAVPFGLLPATDPRVRRSAEAILAHNRFSASGLKGLSIWTPSPEQKNGADSPGAFYRTEHSPLATLWMSRYLLQLGRETGDARYWTDALVLLEGLMDQLGPLRTRLLASQVTPRHPASTTARAWGLQATLIETILDIAGFDFDAAAGQLLLEPILPLEWPSLGMAHQFLCGAARYRLQRTSQRGAGYKLEVETHLDLPVQLKIDLTCPDLGAIKTWDGPTPQPALNTKSRRLAWSYPLPAGPCTLAWSWT
jgi:hypothetical protein